MEKKIIIVTGTNSGFGWLTAISLAASGHKVYATMRDTKSRNADKAKELAGYSNIEVVDIELTDNGSVIKAISEIIRREGKIDVLVNNAGIYTTGIAETFTADDLMNVVNINLI